MNITLFLRQKESLSGHKGKAEQGLASLSEEHTGSEKSRALFGSHSRGAAGWVGSVRQRAPHAHAQTASFLLVSPSEESGYPVFLSTRTLHAFSFAACNEEGLRGADSNHVLHKPDGIHACHRPAWNSVPGLGWLQLPHQLAAFVTFTQTPDHSFSGLLTLPASKMCGTIL